MVSVFTSGYVNTETILHFFSLAFKSYGFAYISPPIFIFLLFTGSSNLGVSLSQLIEWTSGYFWKLLFLFRSVMGLVIFK